MFSSSIHHHIIWSGKCYLLVHIIVEFQLLEISMNCRWVHQPPPHPLLGLMMNSCFGTRFHSSFPENLTMSSRQYVSHLFLLKHPESEVSWHQSDLNLGHVWWLEHFPRVITLVFISPGKVMSCLAHLTGGPIVIVSSLAMLPILSWGNCKTYSTSCSWWILCVSKVRPLLEDHVYATPIINKSIWSTMLNSLYQLSKHHCMGNVM